MVVGYLLIAPNYRNEIANSSIDDSKLDNRAYSSLNTLRITKDIDVYTNKASAIVIRKFTRKGAAEWNSDKIYINTAVYFLVSGVLKGDIKPGTEIKLLQWGGELDGQVQTIDGAFIYNENENNLLFLGTDEIGNWGVFQGDWGQFPIDEAGMVKNFNDKTVSILDFKDEIIKRIK